MRSWQVLPVLPAPLALQPAQALVQVQVQQQAHLQGAERLGARVVLSRPALSGLMKVSHASAGATAESALPGAEKAALSWPAEPLSVAWAPSVWKAALSASTGATAESALPDVEKEELS